ncbi:alpha/beta hydrolase [Variovorax sp. PCZ-1]|uniref:alpha/beta hydrolase n=1 Tax=Variovorax sp. PCZ-1 TaxID=2835533 RepID=UPI001BCC7912|nr:alpha/beta hydrolase [Variovorax sp. PCZ-1]MBS7807323.1 alpha/beta hydrolase [Variovorax sp. PCZ-1]
MQGVLTRMARAQHTPLHELTPSQAREAYEKGADVLEVPKAQLVRVEDMRFTSRDGAEITLRLYAPSHEKLPVLLFFHGGGFVIGSIQTHDILCRELSRLSGAAVISVDYRLAPEHPFPAAQSDAWDALLWLREKAESLGLDVQRIAVGGDSAGGTLAAVCAHLARDAGLPLALQLLIYPGTKGYEMSPSRQQYATGYVLGEEHIRYFFDSTLRSEYDGDWRFSPLNAENFEGLAPLFLALAECDPLHDEGLEYADALRVAGVTVDLEIYRGVTHEFIKMGRILPEARQFHQDAAQALKQAFTH